MSANASAITPAHPVTAGVAPAILWVASQALNLATLAAGLVLAFWYAEHAAQGGSYIALSLAAVIPLYGALFVVRWMLRAARFRTPGGLVPPQDQSIPAQVRARTPGWLATVLEYALTLLIVTRLLRTPSAATSISEAVPGWTAGQLYVVCIVPIMVAAVALLVARAAYQAVAARSWVPLIGAALALVFCATLVRTTAAVQTAGTADITGGLAMTYTGGALLVWAVLSFAPKARNSALSDDSRDLTAALLTWWHGAPTLEDRRHYTPLIHAGMIGLAVMATLSVVALTALL